MDAGREREHLVVAEPDATPGLVRKVELVMEAAAALVRVKTGENLTVRSEHSTSL